MIDRGFIKWQPFNSLINRKMVMSDLEKNKKVKKPTLFPEEIEKINEEILNAYYAKSEITIIYYENNLYKKITTLIVNINSSYKTIQFRGGKVISFNQILQVIN